MRAQNDWCQLYQCWCDDIDDVIDDPGYHCDLDCGNCDARTRIGFQDE